MNIDDSLLRRGAAFFGLSLALFSVPWVIAPRWAGRIFGLPGGQEPVYPVLSRMIGARDIAMGLGLWSAATHGGKYAPWLLARIISDGGDVLWTGAAIAAGARQKAFVGLWGLAAAAAGSAAVQYFLARRAS